MSDAVYLREGPYSMSAGRGSMSEALAMSEKTYAVAMLGPDGTPVDVPVTAEPGLNVEKVLEAQIFKDWVAEIDK